MFSNLAYFLTQYLLHSNEYQMLQMVFKTCVVTSQPHQNTSAY